MKIVQINSVCGTGSTGRLAVQISDYLSENGIENYIAYGIGKSDISNSYKFGNDIDAHIHSFMSRIFGLQGKMSHFTTLKLIGFLKRIKPDIIHLHNIHGHYLNYKMLFRFLKKSGVEVVWTFHDCWAVTGKCAHFTEVGCEKWKTGCYDCPQLERYPDSKRDRSKIAYKEKKKIFNLVEKLHIVTVSDWLKGVASQSYLKKHDIRRIYNGIDTDKFKPTVSSFRDKYGLNDKFVILSVASKWNSRKGLDKFVELSRLMGDEYSVVLIGIEKGQMEGLPKGIIGIPPVTSQGELAEFYSMADVYVNLSIEETFGLVVAEALSCGTPAVVMNSTACPEPIDLNTGIVVNPGSLTVVKDAIEEIKKRGKQYYSEHCRERATKNFTIENMQKNYLTLYCELEETNV